MPELPEITVYVESIEQRIVGQPLERIRIPSPSLLRTYDPPVSALVGKTVRSVERFNKRIVITFDDDLIVVIHLMIAGRFRWKEPGAPIPKKLGQAAFDFPNGTLLLTEAGTKRRASMHVLRGREALADHHRGGIEPLTATPMQFKEALTRENRTLKRALTDPRIFSGIGNAHSDEILHAARLSPIKLTQKLSGEEIKRLRSATIASLREWVEILRSEAADKFPEKVTAFHPRMAVHGRFGLPCPACGSPIQRIAYADNETNYCATCQTEGKLLADRSLSRLLKDDWPKTLEELEELRGGY